MTTTGIEIPMAYLTLYRQYRAEYEEANAVFQALLLRDKRRQLSRYEQRMLLKAEDDTAWAKAAMRRMETHGEAVPRYPARGVLMETVIIVALIVLVIWLVIGIVTAYIVRGLWR